MASEQKLMTPSEACEYLGGMAEQTLAVWRSTKRYGLPYVKIGSKVFYKQADLDAFIAARTVGSADTAAT
jgi:hypothetical protein